MYGLSNKPAVAEKVRSIVKLGEAQNMMINSLFEMLLLWLGMFGRNKHIPMLLCISFCAFLQLCYVYDETIL